VAVENAHLYYELRAERDRIIQAQENTRRELARDLHDGPVQQLSALAMRLEWLERLAEVQPEVVPGELAALRESALQAAEAARLLLFEVRPVILETQGLVPALKSFVDRLSESSPLKLHFDSGGLEPGLDTEVASTVFSIVQEAVTNAEKHAQAQNVWLALHQADSHLIVAIEDDGLGFDVASVESQYDRGNSLGLLNMHERAELIGGVLTLDSGPSRDRPGTLIQLRLALSIAEESRDG
jgi:signal transduction histidine kinase